MPGIPSSMLLPPPAPQSEAEGVQRGKDTPSFEFAPNPITGVVGGVHSANGANPPARRDGSVARHPQNKRFTNK